MDLFLDTNIYLSFYKLSDDDLEELEKLTVAVRSEDTSLYVTDQVRAEFNRNREAVIADSLKAFEGAKLPAGFPRLVMNFPDYDEMREDLKSYELHRRSLLQEVRQAASERKLHADELIDELFRIAKDIPFAEQIWQASRMRYDLGNPPGKKGSYGDAVNWESLLVAVPDGRDLLFVTADSDYISELDDSMLADTLLREWRSKKHSEISL
jgi:hypothetical protein